MHTRIYEYHVDVIVCDVVLRQAMQHCFVLCYLLLGYVMSCCVMLCNVVLHDSGAISAYLMLRYAMASDVI